MEIFTKQIGDFAYAVSFFFFPVAGISVCHKPGSAYNIYKCSSNIYNLAFTCLSCK